MRKSLEVIPAFELAEALLEHLENSNAGEFIGIETMRCIVEHFTAELADIDASLTVDASQTCVPRRVRL